MFRIWPVVVVCLVLAAQCLAEDVEKHGVEAAAASQPQEPQQSQSPPSGPSPGPSPSPSPSSQLTAIRLPSESLAPLRELRELRDLPLAAGPALRAVRALGLSAAKSAARALADNMPSSLSLSSSTVHTLAMAGAVVVGVIGIGALLGLLGLFGFRPCYLLGTCDTYAGHAYLSPNALDAYAYSQPVYQPVTTYAKSYDGVANELSYAYDPYQNAQVVTYPSSNSVAPNAYQKRSLEYVGPILKMLSNAYEKYNHPAHGKSVEKPASGAGEPKAE